MFLFVVYQHCDVCSEFLMPSFIFFDEPFPLDGGSGSVGSGAALLSSSCSLPGFQQLLWEPDGKPSSLPQPQTLNALSLPFFRPRFPVGCGGGGIMLYLSHASFVSGIIISPFLVVGSVRQTSGLF